MLPRQSPRALRSAQLTNWRLHAASVTASCRARSSDARLHPVDTLAPVPDAPSSQELHSKQISKKTTRTIFSGIQPTGVPHLGNYLGALRQWVKLQNESDPNDQLYFSIVDLHAITSPYEPKQLLQWSREMYAALLAVGLNPSRSIIYSQQSVLEHTQLMWLLSCHASMGYLGRMTQWKSKLSLADDASPLDPSPSNKPALKLGLFSYPVLQAADVLLYRATHVPVGEDQAQHLEFARELANTINHAYFNTKGDESCARLPLPQTILSPAKRIMSLQNPTKKMSKSDADPKSRILITDTREEIHAKIKSAVTDSVKGVTYDRELRPGVSNLVDIMYYMDESKYSSPEEIANDMFGKDLSMKAMKQEVADTIDKNLAEVRERYREQMARSRDQVQEEMDSSSLAARRTARATLGRLKMAMGLQHGPMTG